MTTKQRVYLVDDDPSVRDALTTLLDVNGIAVVPFDSGEAFLEAVQPGFAGCVLLDLRLGGISGLDVQQRLRHLNVVMPVVIMTAYGDVATVRTALKSGVHDFLEKPIDHDVLVDVVRNSLDLDARRQQRASQRDELNRKVARLTSRESEVMQHLLLGHQHREIASALGISPRTVEVYKARMMEKLDAKSLADIMRIGSQIEDLEGKSG